MTQSQRRSRRWGWLVAALLAVLLALGLRLRAVDRLPIDYDEDDYLRAGLQYAQAIQAGDWAAFTQLNYRSEHPPLAKIAYGVALAGLPPAPEIPDRPTTSAPASSLPQPHLRVARTVAAAAGTLEVLLLALLDPFAGLLLAVHTFTIKYTSQVMLEAVPALTSALAVVAYERSRRRLNGWLLVSAAALGLTAAGKYVFCIVAPAILIHWIWAAAREGAGPAAAPEAGAGGPPRRRLWRAAVWASLAVAVFLAVDPYLWPAPVQRLGDSILYHAAYSQGANVQAAGLPTWQPLVWLFGSVPWHPGVFLIAVDSLIALLALAGLGRLWQRKRLYALWLAVGLAFLFVWPTKWPQYILGITFPVCLSAAEGTRAVVWEPLGRWWGRVRLGRRGLGQRPWPSVPIARAGPSPKPVKAAVRAQRPRRQLRRALLWLLPGAVVLGLITYYPLVYQVGIALTDFNATSIKDGIRGGIWREVREGLSGAAEPVPINPFSFQRSSSTTVHYVGARPLLSLFGGGAVDVLVFEALWTVLSVTLQAVVGVGAALLLHQRGVRFRGWWQTLFILPWAIPEFVGALIWMQIFDPKFGWFFLGSKSFAETPGYLAAQQLSFWQQNPNAALVVLLLASTWVGFPLIMLAATAGLNLIPGEVYDAAAIDGAGTRHTFQAITWPLLLPLLAPALIIRGIAAFNQFYLFWVLNPPYPMITLASFSFFAFDGAGKYATSAIINLFTVAALIVFLLWFNRRSRAGEGVTYA